MGPFESTIYNFSTQIVEVIFIVIIHAHQLAIDPCNFGFVVVTVYQKDCVLATRIIFGIGFLIYDQHLVLWIAPANFRYVFDWFGSHVSQMMLVENA